MIKILHFFPVYNNAGTEHVIYNILKSINSKAFHLDFCAKSHGELDSKLTRQGSKIYYLDIGNKTVLVRFFKQHPEYKTIHVHTCKEMGVVLSAAKAAGIKNRIMHSHIGRNDLPKFFSILKFIKTYKAIMNSNYKLACSLEAAKWQYSLFWRKALIWENSVDHTIYKYDKNNRAYLRQKLHIPKDAFVLCHVGRFTKQKNHIFLIHVLNILMKQNKNYYAILVGNGENFNEIKKIAESKRIIFTEKKFRTEHVYSASDLLLFPSLYEGMPLVPLETQMNGLPALISNSITKETDLNIGLIKFYSLKNGIDSWCLETNRMLESFDSSKRSILSKKAKISRGNTKVAIKKLEEFYSTIQK